jgi:hypothetical protein
VAGYPQPFEDPTTSWATVNAITGRCQGMHDDDAHMLRGVAGRLNQAIGAEVKAAAARHPDRTWVFADVSIPFAGHGLCSDEGDQWINGLTSGLGAGDFRLLRSFHPTQAGHTDGYANFITTNKVVKQWRPAVLNDGIRGVDLLNASLPSGSCGSEAFGWPHESPITLVNGQGESLTAAGEFGGASITDAQVVGYADFNVDGATDALMSVSCFGSPIDMCCAGRASLLTFGLPVTVGQTGHVSIIGSPILGGNSGGADRKIWEISLEGTDVVTKEAIIYPEQYTDTEVGHPVDADLRVVYRYGGGRWTEVSRRP